jgi:hypothetical protein
MWQERIYIYSTYLNVCTRESIGMYIFSGFPVPVWLNMFEKIQSDKVEKP